MKTARLAFGAARILALLASLLPALATAAWIAVAAMPTGVADFQYASVGGKFYAAGGYTPGGAWPILQVYDPAPTPGHRAPPCPIPATRGRCRP